MKSNVCFKYFVMVLVRISKQIRFGVCLKAIFKFNLPGVRKCLFQMTLYNCKFTNKELPPDLKNESE